MSDWINVKDRLPEGDCLVYLEPDRHSSARMHTACYHPNLTTIGNHFSFDMPKVTHWMPLPEPPEEDIEMIATAARTAMGNDEECT